MAVKILQKSCVSFAILFLIVQIASVFDHNFKMSSGVILAGLALAAIGYGGRALMRSSKIIGDTLSKSIPSSAFSNNKYYRGGFEPKMTRREAGLILGISPSANKNKVRESHKRIMLLNHPDRGGSPYIAAKINEAKDYLDKNSRSGQ
ncbi:mitochondrial import inner membrane translocase subunit TIM14 [Dermatophagoides pteronyssinus]|uniref:mitochondrial import inner membrane translocase subunit TIM14 n=1 Tax=Dermatophagoides pteronyssinus TaxID=6956 RepID=UPI003F6642A3